MVLFVCFREGGESHMGRIDERDVQNTRDPSVRKREERAHPLSNGLSNGLSLVAWRAKKEIAGDRETER